MCEVKITCCLSFIVSLALSFSIAVCLSLSRAHSLSHSHNHYSILVGTAGDPTRAFAAASKAVKTRPRAPRSLCPRPHDSGRLVLERLGRKPSCSRAYTHTHTHAHTRTRARAHVRKPSCARAIDGSTTSLGACHWEFVGGVTGSSRHT